MRIKTIWYYTKQPLRSRKRLHAKILFLAFSIILGFMPFSIGHNHVALSAETVLPRTVLTAIVEAGTDARKEEISKTSTRFSRRAAATKFSSQVISALANYPDHAETIMDNAIFLGKSHRQYIANTIVRIFPGYKNAVSVS